ncbi:MAG: outer membrane beta-barrel protein [Candidatus Eiseniibacteriota bacterium]
MRRVTITALLLLCLPATAGAQLRGDRELTGQVGWMWGGTQEYTSSYQSLPLGDVHANANLTYGGALTYYEHNYLGYEFAYNYQSTDLIIRPRGYPEQKLTDLTTQYLQINGLRLSPMSPKAEGIVLGGLGATVYSAKGYSSAWLFSLGVGVGARIHLNSRTALRLQTRVLIPMRFDTGSFYFGSNGSSVSVSGGTAIIQGEATAGLSIMLGERH